MLGLPWNSLDFQGLEAYYHFAGNRQFGFVRPHSFPPSHGLKESIDAI